MKNFIAALLFFASFSYSGQQPITLFCHGIIDNKTQIDHYQDFIMQPGVSFNFPDAHQPDSWDLNTLIFTSSSLFGKRVNRDNMFMATGQDIDTLREQIDPTKKYILYGFSRGGSAAVNYLGQYNPDNVQALILEASPADMVDAVNNFEHSAGYKLTNNRMQQAQLFNLIFPGYQVDSTPPVENIAHIANKNLPILLIHATDDARVSIDASYQLYLAFKQAGFTDVYFYELNHGVHARYTTGPQKIPYLQALHSFYKKYGFAYNPEFATLDDLATLQPTVDAIAQKLAAHRNKLTAVYEQQKLFNQKALASFAFALAAIGLTWKFYNFESLQTVD